MPDSHAERMTMVRNDCKTDAAALDSAPFTPLGIGETLGTMLALIAAIADTTRVLCEREGI